MNPRPSIPDPIAALERGKERLAFEAAQERFQAELGYPPLVPGGVERATLRAWRNLLPEEAVNAVFPPKENLMNPRPPLSEQIALVEDVVRIIDPDNETLPTWQAILDTLRYLETHRETLRAYIQEQRKSPRGRLPIEAEPAA